jgi:hypothetical protein
MARSEDDHAKIRSLNDEMRTTGSGSKGHNRWIVTSGVLELGLSAVGQALERAMSFDVFNSDNDPYGEHDFGAFEVDGERLYWKIDYYNQTLDGGSPDPTDSAVTVRVLTVLLASEY